MGLLDVMSAALLWAVASNNINGSNTVEYRGWYFNTGGAGSDARRGGRLFLSHNFTNRHVQRTWTQPITADGNTITTGWAFEPYDNGGGVIVVGLGPGNATRFEIGVTSAGAVRISDSLTWVATSAAGVIGDMSGATFYWIEVQFTYASTTTATVTVRVNGTQVVTYTGTFPAALNTVRAISYPYYSQHWMECYILDSSGSVNTTYLGDCRVEHLTPTAVGVHDDWTLGAGANKVAAVTSYTDADSSYIRTPDAGVRQTFTMTDLASTTGTVKGVVGASSAVGENNDTTKVGASVRTGGATYDSTNGQPAVMGSVYGYGAGIFDKNPGTNATWTAAEVNALEAGPVVVV